MGKNAINTQKKKLAKALKKKAAKPSLETLSLTELLARAQEHIDCFQYENAQKYCQEALKREPDYVPALETSASLCLETGNLDGAKHCLGRAITVQPDEGYSKYLSMAQLMEGNESLECYQKGIEILSETVALAQKSENGKSLGGNDKPETENVMTENGTTNEEVLSDEAKADVEQPLTNSGDSKEDKPALIRKISTACCSIAELYMTDLCDEEEAEDQCLAYINKALETDPTNPEAFQFMASYQLVRQQPDEAKTFIKKSIDLWLPKYKEIHEGKAEAGTFDPIDVCPLSYPSRLSAARILIEVQEYDVAVEVLEGLSEEDDEIVDTWYLLGWLNYLQGEEHKDSARHFFHRAKQVQALAPSEDSQLIEHLEELVQELGPLSEEDLEEEAVDEGDIEDELQRESDEEEMDTS
ncbi:probable assembly chaperone of rpl4 [Penaeus japonicus]|uniref:probable assembly chaperone of rpl4 n=1 Tax=Penaeus japonicus TaxID=27405 RepID=UPI001C710808|nr:probable assembly chaperone of rpl4 [Penaeus japonicus]